MPTRVDSPYGDRLSDQFEKARDYFLEKVNERNGVDFNSVFPMDGGAMTDVVSDPDQFEQAMAESYTEYEQTRNSLSVKCPDCGATAGAPCLGAVGIHFDRYAFAGQQALIGDGKMSVMRRGVDRDCLTCGALEGQPCVFSQGQTDHWLPATQDPPGEASAYKRYVNAARVVRELDSKRKTAAEELMVAQLAWLELVAPTPK